MLKLRAILPLVFTIILVYLLDKPHDRLGLPALGRLLDPVNGCWANAEPVDKNFNNELKLSGLKQPVTVWIDDQMVPHINAANEHDLYYAQGYVHAYFRLWQMDMQTRAAAGRVSEVVGPKVLDFDREQRRKGMVYGAENSLRAAEADPATKQMMDAYTAGVNSYIASLNYRNYPLEYKLMGFKPEPWTNLNISLLLKYMADDLTGKTDDIPLTVLRNKLSQEEFDYLFPNSLSGVSPVMPTGTMYDKPSLELPQLVDTSLWSPLDSIDFKENEDEGKGSNNWALRSSKTKAGAPILCNDPHLGLNLPSIWFQVQLQAPGVNVYGVSIPGAPAVVIGFNENISWGVTNNYRDVKDFYAIQPSVDRATYLFEGKQIPFSKRVEKIAVKGKPDINDTVLYTIHGPVIYDERFHGPGGLKKPLALTWMAHKATNDVLAFYLLNRSNNYDEFVSAIIHMECPAQNVIYADKADNIALWGQGRFVNKWKGQGRFIMKGTDSSTLWKEFIPMNENPHAVNPVQNFLSSANQTVTDTTYPYWYNGKFYEFRAWRVNNVLSQLNQATVQDMFKLQNDTYSILAEHALPVMLKYLNVSTLDNTGKQYVDELKKWNYYLSAESKIASVFQVWWNKLNKTIWERFKGIPQDFTPLPERTMQLLETDTSWTASLPEITTKSFKAALDSLSKVKEGIEWMHVKNTSVRHLTRKPAFGFSDLAIGGWENTVNAAKSNIGPSWRMVVQMSKETEAYGIYPGGQSGNPGSKYYAAYLDKWVKGEYNKLVFLPNSSKQQNVAIKYTWTIQPGKQ